MILESRDTETSEKTLSAMTRAERRLEAKKRSRQVVGIVCTKIFNAKAYKKLKKADIWRMVLLCDLIYYDHIMANRAEIQNRTGVRIMDIVLSYENRDYLEVIDIPQEYTVAFKKLSWDEFEREDGTIVSTPRHSGILTSGLFYLKADAEKHATEMKAEFDEVLDVTIAVRDSFVFDESDPDGQIRPGKWRLEKLPKHQQVIATHPTLGDIEVDEGLAQFLEALWELHFETAYSCEGSVNRTDLSRLDDRYILFEDEENAVKFVEKFGGVLDSLEYKEGRRAVRGFRIPKNIEIYRPTNK